MKDWKHATQQEVDAMTFDEAHEIIQRHIDNGVRAIELGSGRGTDFAPRAHMTKALQIIVDRADKAEKYEEFIRKVINEIHTDHYGDATVALIDVCKILSEAEKFINEVR